MRRPLRPASSQRRSSPSNPQIALPISATSFRTTKPALHSATSGKLQCSEITTGKPAAKASRTALAEPLRVGRQDKHVSASQRRQLVQPVKCARESHTLGQAGRLQQQRYL